MFGGSHTYAYSQGLTAVPGESQSSRSLRRVTWPYIYIHAHAHIHIYIYVTYT